MPPSERDHPDDVDFVVGGRDGEAPGAPADDGEAPSAPADDGAPETVDDPLDAGRGPLWRAGRRRLDLAVGALVLVGALLVARAVTGGHDSPTSSAGRTPGSPVGTSSGSPSESSTSPATSAPVTSPPAVVTFGPPPLGVPRREAGDPAACPHADDGLPLCEVTRTAPRPLLAAIRFSFPRFRIQDALTEQLRDAGFGPGGLFYREVSAMSGDRRLRVQVFRSRSDDVATTAARTIGRRTLIVSYAVQNGYTSAVTYTFPSPPGGGLSVGLQFSLGRLAADPRTFSGE